MPLSAQSALPGRGAARRARARARRGDIRHATFMHRPLSVLKSTPVSSTTTTRPKTWPPQRGWPWWCCCLQASLPRGSSRWVEDWVDAQLIAGWWPRLAPPGPRSCFVLTRPRLPPPPSQGDPTVVTKHWEGPGFSATLQSVEVDSRWGNESRGPGPPPGHALARTPTAWQGPAAAIRSGAAGTPPQCSGARRARRPCGTARARPAVRGLTPPPLPSPAPAVTSMARFPRTPPPPAARCSRPRAPRAQRSRW